MSAAIQYTIPDLAAMLADRTLDVAKFLLPNGKLFGNYFCVGSVDGEAGQSLKVNVKGKELGFWKDYAGKKDEKGDLVELWTRARGIPKGKALQEIREFLGIGKAPGPHTLPAKPAAVTRIAAPEKQEEPDKPISREYHRNLISRLIKNAGAMNYLHGEKRGLTDETIRHFGLGLSETSSNGSENAITAPLKSFVDGSFSNRAAHITIPGVTRNPVSENGWMKGRVRSYYSDASKHQCIVFICEGMKDVWRHWQALAEAKMTDDILLVTGTHGAGNFPNEWKSEEFWKPWDRVYIGLDNDDAGDRATERLLEYIGREAHRIVVPAAYGKDWSDFWQNGGTIEGFRILLDEAPVASGAKLEEQASPNAENLSHIGRFSYKPVDVNGAYVNGHLYYPTETHVIKKDEASDQLVECLETIVIRSDRTVHRACYAPAPPGTPLNKRVLKLTDGTIIRKEPHASKIRTWDYESIKAFLDGTAKVRSLSLIFKDVLSALQQAIWLPYEEDYVALALTVPVTYLQVVFESVPLLLLNGPGGSGKSQTGNAMARLCANGAVIGQISAATTARLIDETRGFVVLDDVESIAAKGGKDVQITELVQALKVSYNRHTAVKLWTDVKTMKIEELNFFGVKLLNNTLGADAILASRMIRIQTRKMPEGMKSNVREFSVDDLIALRALRNELHTWAFQQVDAVVKVYSEVYANKTDRHAEISAPLRTIARLIGDPAVAVQFEACLARQHLQQDVLNDNPVETLKEAVRNLLKQGFDTVTLTHLRLEMRVLLDANYGMSSTTEIPEWDRPEWIGRQLRLNDLVADVVLGRKRVYGKNLRLVRFSDWVIKEVTHSEDGNPVYATNKDPEAFCKGCAQCTYLNAGCELQGLRMREENRQPMRARKSH